MNPDAKPDPLPSGCLVVIPARLASTRLPQKLLLSETGKPLIQHTYEGALRAKLPSAVCVATDHVRIQAVVESFGGQAILTSPEAQSGTDRVAEVARSRPDVELLVNVQGDEPEIRGETIDRAIGLLREHPKAEMATMATPIRSRAQLDDPACVKVVCDDEGRAMYFSRSVIPYPRQWDERWLAEERFLQHIGIYAYRRDALLRLTALPPHPLEQMESLEQLRALAAGFTIRVAVIDEPTVGIDTPEDYRAFVSRAESC